jgi:hypothetical protein
MVYTYLRGNQRIFLLHHRRFYERNCLIPPATLSNSVYPVSIFINLFITAYHEVNNCQRWSHRSFKLIIPLLLLIEP